MFIFGSPHIFQQESVNIQQVLVFSCARMQEQFELEVQKRKCLNKGYSHISNNQISFDNAGAIYKLQAVSNGKEFLSVIRCGVTGTLLVEYNLHCKESLGALNQVKVRLLKSINASFELELVKPK